jgi:hypothetical protein
VSGETNDTHAGGCLCGAVRFAFTGRPKWVAHCHCQSCRRNTGAAFATWIGVAADQFRWTRGEATRFSSSPKVWRGFCAACGTPLTYEAERWAGEVHINVGTLDEPGRFPPTAHVHYAERVAWLKMPDGLPRYAATGGDSIRLPDEG